MNFAVESVAIGIRCSQMWNECTVAVNVIVTCNSDAVKYNMHVNKTTSIEDVQRKL